MKRRLFCFILALATLYSSVIYATEVDPKRESNVNINDPNKTKNWFDDYQTNYDPPETLPKSASPATGYRSLSDASYFEYKQSLGSLNAQVSNFYVNSFEEIFAPGVERVYPDLIEVITPPPKTPTGVKAFDDFEFDEFEGLSEEELKWLINNHIITRDPESMVFELDSIDIGAVPVLYTKGTKVPMLKMEFLMALHKSTYGVIESRPIVMDLNAYRKAEKVTWRKVRDMYGNHIGYSMVVGEFKDQLVDSEGKGPIDTYESLDRHEFKVRLENDTHYSMVTYPLHDKLFITSPNVFELYLKSYLDKGIINSKNLDPSYTTSKNLIENGASFKNLLDSYGKITVSKSQTYPAWAFELGPYEAKNEANHVYFTPEIVGDRAQVWGKRYNISNNTIESSGEDKYFVDEGLTTMEALKYIELILRQTEGDMSSTEAQIVSYKYGANIIDKFSGKDKDTVAYLTAKGILNFEDFNEYTFMYTPFEEEFGYTLLYRVANKNARKSFTQIQLTDSDSFWIGKGFSSYQMDVAVPNPAAIQPYLDKSGDLTLDPSRTGDIDRTDKVFAGIFPAIHTKAVVIGEEVNDTGNIGATAAAARTAPLFNSGASSEDFLLDDSPLIGASVFDTMRTDFHSSNSAGFLGVYSMNSPFADEVIKSPVSDKKNFEIDVEKLVDNPWGYLYAGKQIVDGESPITKPERASSTPTKHENADPAVKSITYDENQDRYLVVFQVQAADAQAALQLVDSNLTFANTLAEKQPVQVVSKVMNNGNTVILINSQAFPLIDSELIVVDDRILINRRTGAKAIFLAEQNVALIGNEIVEADEDTLMVVANDSQIYYNLEVIRSLLTNTFLSEIGKCEFISGGDIQPEKAMDVYSNTGEKVATALIGSYKLTEESGSGDPGGIPEEHESIRDFINISQLTTGNNILTKEITRTTTDNIDVIFRMIVEWKLMLPPSTENFPAEWADASKNPTIREINSFFYTRPDDKLELADWWDNNIAVSNALANVMYGTTKRNYITCGYLVPNLTVLFYADDPMNDGTVNALATENIYPIIGEWLQEVGKEIPQSWVNTFVGNYELYNKILSTTDALNSKHSSWTPSDKYASSGDIVMSGEQYTITANEGSKYYPDKLINTNWFPAWVHIFFNNANNAAYDPINAVNTRTWREYATTRSFMVTECDERRSEGNLFGNKSADSPGWMILHTGAVYKKIIGADYIVKGNVVIANTRDRTTDLSLYKNKIVMYEGKRYYLSRLDAQYLELVSVDDTVTGRFSSAASPEFISDSGANFQEAGYEALKLIFTGSSASPDYDRKKDTVDLFQADLGNMMNVPTCYVAGNVYVVIDDMGVQHVVRIGTQLDGNGTVVLKREMLKALDYRNSPAYYNPTIRLSLLGWNIEKDSTGGELKLTNKRSLPALLYDGFYPSALSRTVVDTLITQSVGGEVINDLPAGSIVLFGDSYFYKEADGSFTSTPIPLSSSDIPKLNSSGKIRQEDLDLIAVKTLNLPVDVNGRVSTVASYINKVRLGPAVDNEKYKYNGTIIAGDLSTQKPMYAVQDLKTHAYHVGDTVLSLSVNVTLDTGLMAMPIDKANKTYLLLFSSSSEGQDELIDMPYYPEDSKIALIDAPKLDAFVADFRALPNQDDIRAEFRKEDLIQTGKDIVWWIECILCTLIAYLLIMCVMLWFVLHHNNVMYVTLRNLKYPSNKSKGFDVIKLMSFGVMDLDTEVSGYKLINSMFLLCVLFTVIVLFANRV